MVSKEYHMRKLAFWKLIGIDFLWLTVNIRLYAGRSHYRCNSVESKKVKSVPPRRQIARPQI